MLNKQFQINKTQSLDFVFWLFPLWNLLLRNPSLRSLFTLLMNSLLWNL